MGITWGPEGILQLRDNKEIQVQTAEEINTFSAQLAAKITIPSQSLIVVPVTMVLPSCENKTHFDFTPIQEHTRLGPNCVVYPLDYASIKGGLQKGFQVLINLDYQELELQQGVILGHFQKASPEEIMITQEDIFGVNMEESWKPKEI